LALLIVRGLPSMLAAPEGSTFRERASVALLGATALPIIVAVTAIGVEEGILSSAASALLVGAGMLSVLLFPLIAMTLRGERRALSATPVEDDAA
ncbi:MAG: cation:proton antiporter, partial [Microbacterium sp.]